VLYSVLYRIDRVAKKTTIVIPDANGLTIEASSFSQACAKAQVEAAAFFSQAKLRGEKINRRTPIDEVEKLSGYKGWSVAAIEIDARAEMTSGEDYPRATFRWAAGGGKR
jgi:hypothetical protein